MEKFLALFLLCVSLGFAEQPFEQDSLSALNSLQAAPAKLAKANWKKGRLTQLRFENPREMEPDALWSLLDWAGGEAGWMEIDFGGYLAPEMKARIQGAKQAWFRQAPGVTTLLATLKGKISATVEITALEDGKEVRQPLECRYKGELDIFKDFSARNSELCALSKSGKCLFVHGEDSRLTAEATSRTISMVLRLPDNEPFPLVEAFSMLSDAQKDVSVEEYRIYFQHEFNLAVRSFVETVPGLFNWQVWQWMQWGVDYLLPKQEIRALLESGQRPGRMDLFKTACKDGRKVRIWTDGQGTLGMQLQ